MPEKTITISGRPVAFKATGGLAYRYKSQFGREVMCDLVAIAEAASTSDYDAVAASLEYMYNILWTMARTADPAVPDPQTWLDSFDRFPVQEVYEQLEDILDENLEIAPKNV